jgi:3-deoxy-D-manno-octulosonic acid kinase
MRAAANFRNTRASTVDPGPDFPTFGLGKRLLYIRRDFAPRAPIVFERLAALEQSPASGAGNRGSGHVIELEQGVRLFVRRSRRGGLARFALSELYFGTRPRPVRELAITSEAHRRGVPVAEPIGAAVEWMAPGLYRGSFLSRPLAGMTLWEFMRTDDDRMVRAHVIAEARRAVDAMHQLGLFHADLNLHNLFVTKAGEELTVVILDLDKARLFRASLALALRRRNFARLLRSARKLDRDRQYLDERALTMLTAP